MRDSILNDIILLLGIGTIFLGAGLEFASPYSLTSGTCFGIGGTLLAVYDPQKKVKVDRDLN